MGSLRTFRKINDHDVVDLYTQNIGLTQKAQFWSTYLSALKGNECITVHEDVNTRTWYPSITETIPEDYPGLRHEMSKLENQILTRPYRQGPLSRVLPDAHDRILTDGYHYTPVHTTVYGTLRARTARVS